MIASRIRPENKTFEALKLSTKHTQCFKALKNYKKQLQSLLPSKQPSSNTMLEIDNGLMKN
jgi:hypothetical protein